MAGALPVKTVIEWACDSGGTNSKKPGYEPCEFEISEVSGNKDLRALVQGDLKDRFAVGDQKVLVPILAVDFSGSMGDFADHQQQVLPHFLLDIARLGRGPLGEHKLQIFLDEPSTNLHMVGQDVSYNATESLAAFDRHRLKNCDEQSENHVDQFVLEVVALVFWNLAIFFTVHGEIRFPRVGCKTLINALWRFWL